MAPSAISEALRPRMLNVMFISSCARRHQGKLPRESEGLNAGTSYSGPRVGRFIRHRSELDAKSGTDILPTEVVHWAINLPYFFPWSCSRVHHLARGQTTNSGYLCICFSDRDNGNFNTGKRRDRNYPIVSLKGNIWSD